MKYFGIFSAFDIGREVVCDSFSPENKRMVATIHECFYLMRVARFSKQTYRTPSQI